MIQILRFHALLFLLKTYIIFLKLSKLICYLICSFYYRFLFKKINNRLEDFFNLIVVYYLFFIPTLTIEANKELVEYKKDLLEIHNKLSFTQKVYWQILNINLGLLFLFLTISLVNKIFL